MKTIQFLTLLFFIILSVKVKAQNLPEATGFPEKMSKALKIDDTLSLANELTNDNINNCYGSYSLLSQSIRFNATKCFKLLIEKGADVNKSCNGYVPPLMHAAKYGRMDMVKILVTKGANINYTYHGDYEAAVGQTPITYAEMYKHPDIADYLRSIKNK